MKKAILIFLIAVLILTGTSFTLQFAHSDMQTEGNTLLAAEVGSDAWKEENRRREVREIKRQEKRIKEAEKRAEKARNKREWERAQKDAKDAAKKKWQAEQRRDLPLEKIPQKKLK